MILAFAQDRSSARGHLGRNTDDRFHFRKAGPPQRHAADARPRRCAAGAPGAGPHAGPRRLTVDLIRASRLWISRRARRSRRRGLHPWPPPRAPAWLPNGSSESGHGPFRIAGNKAAFEKAPPEAARAEAKLYDFPSGSLRTLTFKKGGPVMHQITFETEIYVLSGLGHAHAAARSSGQADEGQRRRRAVPADRLSQRIRKAAEDFVDPSGFRQPDRTRSQVR